MNQWMVFDSAIQRRQEEISSRLIRLRTRLAELRLDRRTGSSTAQAKAAARLADESTLHAYDAQVRSISRHLHAAAVHDRIAELCASAGREERARAQSAAGAIERARAAEEEAKWYSGLPKC